MALCIERVPLVTEKKVLKVLRLCEQHDLREQGWLSGCVAPVTRCMHSPPLQSATFVPWFMRCLNSVVHLHDTCGVEILNTAVLVSTLSNFLEFLLILQSIIQQLTDSHS